MRYQYYLEEKAGCAGHKPAIGRVLAKWDPGENELIVEDTGTGMDLDRILYHLMLVGASFYDTPKFHSENPGFTPISRFGIGVLTCFMVSDDIEIITCQAQGGYRIRMTSVHSDYLLKKLEPGHPSLKGIEPHGTRVRLKIRNVVDLEKLNILDIMRYWVIFPPCPVFYQEQGQQEIRVGFETLDQALRYSHYEDDGGPLKDEATFKIKVVHKELDGASYQLAFATTRSITPERNFVRTLWRTAPAVCIEGIRASSRLPGFGPDSRSGHLCALLSVHGNKKFRTTVSRMDLEREPGVFKGCGNLCTNILRSHRK